MVSKKPKIDFLLFIFKETVSVISNEPLCKNGDARFTTVTLKVLSDQVLIRNQCL